MANKIEQIRKAVARLRAASVPPTTVVRSTKGEKGDRGERGEKGTSFRWRGQVRKGMGFSPNDVVHYKGAAYLCLAATTDPPPSDSWAVMCKAEDGRDGRDGAQGAVGPQGEQGVQGPQGEAGADGLRWRGAYSQGQRYEVGDVVGYEGGAFVCVAATVQPPVTGAGWQVLAEPGKTGPRGPKGERGADGTGGGGGALVDGDYGDILVSGSGLVWTIDNGAITPAKLSTGGPQWTSNGAVLVDLGATTLPVDALTVKSTADGAQAAPDLVLTRLSPTPANNDTLGRIRFRGYNSVSGEETYANIHAQISDVTAGSIDGQLHFSVHVNGSATDRVKITEEASATSTTAASVVVTGGIGVSGAAFIGGTGSVAGVLSATSGTASSSTGTGAVVVTGGIGVSGAAFIGGVGNVAGVLTAANTTESTSTTTGGLVCSGGIASAKIVRGATLMSTESNGASTIINQSSQLLSGMTGGYAVATELIPANCVLIGISVRVVTEITGATSFDVFDLTYSNYYLTGVGVTVGTKAIGACENSAASFPNAADVRIQSVGASFTGGAVRIVAHYITLEEPT